VEAFSIAFGIVAGIGLAGILVIAVGRVVFWWLDRQGYREGCR